MGFQYVVSTYIKLCCCLRADVLGSCVHFLCRAMTMASVVSLGCLALGYGFRYSRSMCVSALQEWVRGVHPELAC